MEENKKNKIPNVPNLRLSGFANDYQKTKIGRCLKIKSGQDQKGICCDNGLPSFTVSCVHYLIKEIVPCVGVPLLA